MNHSPTLMTGGTISRYISVTRSLPCLRLFSLAPIHCPGGTWPHWLFSLGAISELPSLHIPPKGFGSMASSTTRMVRSVARLLDIAWEFWLLQLSSTSSFTSSFGFVNGSSRQRLVSWANTAQRIRSILALMISRWETTLTSDNNNLLTLGGRESH